jgi:hypothetical protein
MSNENQINLAQSRDKRPSEPPLTDVMAEGIAFQLLQGLMRIENRLASIESRLQSGERGVPTRRILAEKPNLRNQLTALLMKGWVSETEVIEFTGRMGQTPWQTIGVRSFVTKLRNLGLSVETEERDGVPHYRIAK